MKWSSCLWSSVQLSCKYSQSVLHLSSIHCALDWCAVWRSAVGLEAPARSSGHCFYFMSCWTQRVLPSLSNFSILCDEFLSCQPCHPSRDPGKQLERYNGPLETSDLKRRANIVACFSCLRQCIDSKHTLILHIIYLHKCRSKDVRLKLTVTTKWPQNKMFLHQNVILFIAVKYQRVPLWPCAHYKTIQYYVIREIFLPFLTV